MQAFYSIVLLDGTTTVGLHYTGDNGIAKGGVAVPHPS